MEQPPAARATEPLPPVRRRTWFTWAACVISVVVFAGLAAEGDSPSWEVYSKWGAPPADEIWSGAYWALLTSVFVHIALWHLAFNVYWLWTLGGTLERLIGTIRFLLFFTASAVVGSGMELASAGTTGVGLSGVVYAIFGFLWIAKRRFPSLEAVVSRRTVTIFLIWLLGCLAATFLKIWEVGNAAHVSGLIFGVLLASSVGVARSPLFFKIAAAALLVLSLVPVFWCPWSFWWVSHRAYEAHGKEKYETAVDWYRRSLRFNQERVWVLQNLALACSSLGNQKDYAATLQLLRGLNPSAAAEVERSVAEAQPAKAGKPK